MNYIADNPNKPICESCAMECWPDDIEDDGLCTDCAAKAAREAKAEAARDFQFLARWWLTRDLLRKTMEQLMDEKLAEFLAEPIKESA